MWRKGNSSTLLVGMQTGAATVENSMEFPQKIKMELPFDPAIPLLGLYPKNPETPIQKNLCTPMFIVVLFTITKCCKQPRVPVSGWVDQKMVVRLHNGILHSREKKGIPTPCNSMDGIGEHYSKWNKQVREIQISYDLTYKRNPTNKIN